MDRKTSSIFFQQKWHVYEKKKNTSQKLFEKFSILKYVFFVVLGDVGGPFTYIML